MEIKKNLESRVRMSSKPRVSSEKAPWNSQFLTKEKQQIKAKNVSATRYNQPLLPLGFVITSMGFHLYLGVYMAISTC